jgi:hypothetical protein
MRKMLNEMAENGVKTLFSMVRKETRVVVEGMDLATKDDLREMEKRLGEKSKKKKSSKK